MPAFGIYEIDPRAEIHQALLSQFYLHVEFWSEIYPYKTKIAEF